MSAVTWVNLPQWQTFSFLHLKLVFHDVKLVDKVMAILNVYFVL